jgi:23S rRNA (uracil1939-C5)-methyltransferase
MAAESLVAHIESLDHEGHGVAHVDGKVVFIDGAITGETVAFNRHRGRGNYDIGTTTAVLRESSLRVKPRCRYFGMCGGCAMQHIDAYGQLAAKQRVLEDNLERIGKVRPEEVLPPIAGETWGYRGRARLSVHYVAKKGGVLVGFHEKKSSYVADTMSCEVLPARVSAMIPALREMFTGMKLRDRLPQVELAVGEDVIVLVLRNLEPLPQEDFDALRRFADAHGVQWWLQAKGPETATPLYPLDAPALNYRLPEFGLTLGYRPTEFTQVNAGVNRVHGIEGYAPLIARAEENARANGLEKLATFSVADLFVDAETTVRNLGKPDKLLIDPPRDGAVDVCKSLPEAGPRTIVYVSCSPATLARDAGVLVHVKGYRLVAAGVANMFPHTAHVESIALFKKGN